MVKEYTVFNVGGQDRYRMVFPTPQNEEYGDGVYPLQNIYDTEDLYLFYCENKAGNSDISIVWRSVLEEEEYWISISAGGIQLTCASEAGLFRAMTSLRQLIRYGEGKEVPYAEIRDKPQFKHRGVILSIAESRRRYKPDFLCKIIDYMAGLKYNEIQLSMDTTDCFQFEAFPYLNQDGECMTAQDIRRIDQYASERFIELVPVYNCFGHMHSWVQREEFQHLEVGDETTRTGTLNILDPEAFALVDRIYASLLPHFSSKRVNICLDEAFGLGSFQLEQICKEKGKTQVFMDWLNKISELCERKYGKTVLFWSDMIAEEPEYFSQIPKSAVPIEWGYEDSDAQMIPDHCRDLHAAGRQFYVAPSTNTWFSLTARYELTLNNLRAHAEVGQKYGADGYLLTIWAGRGFVWELVPLALAGQYAWNVGVKQKCGWWRKNYFVHNAQDYVDRYILGSRVSRDICKVSEYYLLEPERVACGTILEHSICMPLRENIKLNSYDITEIYEEYHVDRIIDSVTEVVKTVSRMAFEPFFKREFLMDAQTIILGAEYIRLRLRGGITAQKFRELQELSDWVIQENNAVKKMLNYAKGEDAFLDGIRDKQKEMADFLLQ